MPQAVAPVGAVIVLPALSLIVRLSSERAYEAARQDCSLPRRQQSPPALVVVVHPGCVMLGGARRPHAGESSSERPLEAGSGEEQGR